MVSEILPSPFLIRMVHVPMYAFKHCLYSLYRIEGNFGGCKLWRIYYKNTVGEINFGKFERLLCYLVLNKVFWLKKVWRIYGHLPNPPMFPPSKVSLHTVYADCSIGEY